MYYYLTVSFDTHDLCLNESSDLVGPFNTEKERADGIADDLGQRDLETSEVVNITLLAAKEDGSIISQCSYIAPLYCDNPDQQRVAALNHGKYD